MNKKEKWIVVIVIILILAFIFNLCGIADMLDRAIHPEEEKEEEEEEIEEPPEEKPEEKSCSEVQYSVSVNGATTKWTASGMPESTFLEATQQLAGGYKWQAYWDRNPMGHLSPEYNDKFQLEFYLRNLPSSDIWDEQKWWYSCMITTGYGGLP